MMAKTYDHTQHAGNHGDVVKHIIYRTLIQELQKDNPEGLVIVDAFAGKGLYDLSEQSSAEWEKGVAKVAAYVDEDTTPIAIREYLQVIKEIDSFFQTYPGSPVFADKLLRPQDQLIVIDEHVEEVEGLENEATFIQMDSFDEDNIEYLLPDTDKHTLILIDPPYNDDNHFSLAKSFMEKLLAIRKDATIAIWFPLIENNRYRYGFHKMMKDSAVKPTVTGHYSVSILVEKHKMQGSVFFVANPTKDFDQVMTDEVIDWLSAHLVTTGRSDFVVDQWEKKVRKKSKE